MQAAFESVVPTDWSTAAPVEGPSSWKPGRTSSHRKSGGDYVGIGGDVYSEAVIDAHFR
jgi:hypothetical protein